MVILLCLVQNRCSKCNCWVLFNSLFCFVCLGFFLHCVVHNVAIPSNWKQSINILLFLLHYMMLQFLLIGSINTQPRLLCPIILVVGSADKATCLIYPKQKEKEMNKRCLLSEVSNLQCSNRQVSIYLSASTHRPQMK